MNVLTQALGHAETTSTYRRTTPTLLQAIGASIWRSLEAVGHRRAARELAQLANRWAVFDPALAHDLRQASHDESLRADGVLGEAR